MEPALERDQVHARAAGGSRSRSTRDARRGDAPRARHRQRHSGGVPAARVRALPPGRQQRRAPARRARPRAGDRAPPGRAARRHRARRERARWAAPCSRRRCRASRRRDARRARCSVRAPRAGVDRRQRLRLDGIRVLLVEDEPDARECAERRALELLGAEVVAVGFRRRRAPGAAAAAARRACCRTSACRARTATR